MLLGPIEDSLDRPIYESNAPLQSLISPALHWRAKQIDQTLLRLLGGSIIGPTPVVSLVLCSQARKNPDRTKVPNSAAAYV
jgi:hypothetical protein